MDLAYSVSWPAPEEIASADPFRGHGLYLAAPALGPAEVGRLVHDLLGLPCVAWEDHAWVDLSAAGEDPREVSARWEAAMAVARK